MRGGERGTIPVVDVVITVALVVISWLVGEQYSPTSWGPDPLAYVLTALIMLPFAVRSRAPVLAFAASTTMLLVFLSFGYTQIAFNFWAPVLLLYTVASLRPPRITGLCTGSVMPVLFWAALAANTAWYVGVAQAVLIPLTAWMLGNVGRELGLRNRQLAVLTEQLRVEQELRTQQAVTEERLRIARELHDVVAHHISVIAVQTGVAGYVFEDDPPTAKAAVDTIASISREALAEMRRLLMLLRTDDEPGDTALSLAHLPELTDRMRTTGLPVSLDMPLADMADLPSGMQLCAYRVVQEALTNVMKHAGFAPTEVRLRRDTDQLTVRIANEKGTPAGSSEGTGHGLNNMRERAALYRGTLSAGEQPGGGFVVELTLPCGVND